MTETWFDPRLRFGDSLIHGRGILSSAPIEKGERVLVWGDCYTDREGARKALLAGMGIMQWDEDLFSYECELQYTDESGTKGDPFAINHSCDANCWMADARTLEARRDIQAGEELTVDCAFWEADDHFVSEWECNCGSELCRGRITGRDWRKREVQERYRGHFSPLMERRIEEEDGIYDHTDPEQ